MGDLQSSLRELSLVTANFGDGVVLRRVLEDWFGFVGGRPGQVVVLDNGSDESTRRASFECYEAGLIDKLVLVHPQHGDTGKDRAHIAEHTAPAIASRPYLLFFKIDCLPFRKGHENWLAEAVGYLDRPDTFAFGGSFNVPSKHHEAWPGWYFSDKCSENFALMKREMFIESMREYAGQYISSGFRGENPSSRTGQDRYLVELAWEQYIERHQKYTLVRQEDESWTIFHTNVHGQKLAATREKYLKREDVARYMNAAPVSRIPGPTYYGQRPTRWQEMRYLFGQSAAGPAWRWIKNFLRPGRGVRS